MNQSIPNQSSGSIDPDVGLMLRVKEDDAVAFEELIDRHQTKIIRFMRGWVSTPEQAEDLAQDVFLRVYKARKSYVPTAKFTTWLYRIAHNIASNYIRDSSHRKEFQLTGDGTPSEALSIEHLAVAPSGFQPTRNMDRSERSNFILQAIQALGERQRTAIMLSKFETMSYQEIADTMGLSVQAVKSLLSRARVNLKLMLEPYLESGQGSVPVNADELESGSDEGVGV